MKSKFNLSLKHRREIRRIFSEAGVSRPIDDTLEKLTHVASRCWRVLQKGETLAVVSADSSFRKLKTMGEIWEHCLDSRRNDDHAAAFMRMYINSYRRAVAKMWSSKKKGNRAIRQLADEVNATWVQTTGISLPFPMSDEHREYWRTARQCPTLLWIMLDAVDVDVGCHAVDLLTSYAHGKSLGAILG